jgi:hypothetical protein
MTLSPRILKGGLVLLDFTSSRILRIIVMQYNPETIRAPSRRRPSRTTTRIGRRRSIKSPAVETLKLEAAIDATDQLEFPDLNPVTVAVGIAPQLAAIETLIQPPTDRLVLNNTLV